MKKINMVVVPFHDWKKCEREGFRTRDAHMIEEFRKHPLINKILIVDRPTSMAEMMLLRRPWHIHGGQTEYQLGRNRLTKLDEKTFVLDMYTLDVLNPILKQRSWIPKIYGKNSTNIAVKEAVRHLDIKDYVLIMFSPLSMPLYKQLQSPYLVVDAVDNMLKIPQFSEIKFEINNYYDEIRQNATIVFSNTIETTTWLSRQSDAAIYIPNGVDFHHFRLTDNKVPDDLQMLSKPIVGYAGKMQEEFDVELMQNTALAFPNVTFVCIGQLLNPKWMKPLWELPNVKYLGDKHYDLLPSYLANFDVCMIPYNLERQHANDPIKFYEYLSMGKTIVTTNIGGVSAFADVPQVKVVSNAAEFIAALKHFLTLIRDGVKLPLVDLPREVLWSTKADFMINAIQQKIYKNE